MENHDLQAKATNMKKLNAPLAMPRVFLRMYFFVSFFLKAFSESECVSGINCKIKKI